MTARNLVAGLLAGLVVFAWSAVSHMALPLGGVGLSGLPDEQAVTTVLGAAVPERGLYVFPFATDPAQLERAYRLGPHGLLSVVPAGGKLDFPGRLVREAGSNLLAGLLAVLLLAATPALTSWLGRLLSGATLGAFAAIAIDFSYGIFYDFPLTYLTAQLADQAVGWALGIAAAGWWLHRKG